MESSNRIIPTASDNIRHVSNIVYHRESVVGNQYNVYESILPAIKLNQNKLYTIQKFDLKNGIYIDALSTLGTILTLVPVIKAVLLTDQGARFVTGRINAGSSFIYNGVLNNPNLTLSGVDILPYKATSPQNIVTGYANSLRFGAAFGGYNAGDFIEPIIDSVVWQNAIQPFATISNKEFSFKSGNFKYLAFIVDPSLGWISNGAASDVNFTYQGFVNFDLYEYELARGR
jgi:hypothetical protein